MFCLGSCISYCVVIGDILMPIVNRLHEDYEFIDRRFAITLFWLFCIVPLSILKNVDAITSYSMYAVLLLYYIIFMVVYYSVYSNLL